MAITSPMCSNCIDIVYMDDLGDDFFRCPVCGDELDLKYPSDSPFGDEYHACYEVAYHRTQSLSSPRYTPRRIALTVIVVVAWIMFLLAVANVTGF